MNKNLTPAQRRRKLFAYFVLVQLEHGRQASVVWQGAHKCLVNAPVFSKTLGCDTSELRKAVDWLKSHGYLTRLDWGRGFISCTLKPPIDRTPREELLIEDATAEFGGVRRIGPGRGSSSGAA